MTSKEIRELAPAELTTKLRETREQLLQLRPLYHKIVNRQTVLHVHDEKNETKLGDKVEVMETRPLSRLKRWRIVSVVQKAITTDAIAISEVDVAAQVPTKTTTANQSASPEAQ